MVGVLGTAIWGGALANQLRYNSNALPEKSCVLSFENFTSVPIFGKKTCQHFDEHSNQTQEKTRKPLKREINSSQTLDHIMAERKRRENLTKMFIALSALIFWLEKDGQGFCSEQGDKATNKCPSLKLIISQVLWFV